MRGVLVEVPPSLIEERRAQGNDLFDEMWEGVLHMNPPPSPRHQRLGGRLFRVLYPRAEAVGLVGSYETGLYRSETSYRTPDLIVYAPDDESDRGVERRAALVVEILSPHDETYEKFGFYAECEVPELLVVDPITKRVELYVLAGGEFRRVQPDASGAVRLASVDLWLRATEDGIVAEWDGGSATIA